MPTRVRPYNRWTEKAASQWMRSAYQGDFRELEGVEMNSRVFGAFTVCRMVLAGTLSLAAGCSIAPEPEAVSPVLSCQAGGFLESEEGRALADRSDLGVLNQRLFLLNEKRRESTRASEKEAFHSRLRTVARERAELLSSRVRENPGLVFQTRLTDAMRQALPADARTCLEHSQVVEGELEVYAIDRERGMERGRGDFEYFLNSGTGRRYSLHFARELPAHRSGARLRVRGMRLPCATGADDPRVETLALESGIQDVEALSAPLSRTVGVQSTAVILVNFQDKVGTYTHESVQSLVFGKVSDYFKEASFGQTWLEGNTFGPYTIGLSSTVCDSTNLASQAKKAVAADGVSLSGYGRIIYVFPKSACSWYGLGTIGGWPSQSWINGSFVLHTVAHELGHNFGLYHANASDCGTSASIGDSCSTISYGDTSDVMGGKLPGHFNAFQKERLGWLGYGASPPIRTVTESGTFDLEPYETQTGGDKALKVLKSRNATTGAGTWYYLEYRQPLGFDSVLARYTSYNLTKGILFHSGSESSGNSSLLLNMNPALASWYKAALEPNQLFEDIGAKAGFRLLSSSSSGATVEVKLGDEPPPCVRSNPLVEIAPVQSEWLEPGAEALFSVTLTNRDSVECASSSFGLDVALPSGLTYRTSSSAAVLAPGGTAPVSLWVSSAPGLPSGSHLLNVTARHGGDSAKAATATATWLSARPSDPATVAVSADKTAYSAGEDVGIRVNFAADGAPAAGVEHTITVITPTGERLVTEASSDASGARFEIYQLGSCPQPGLYEVHVSGSVGSEQVETRTVFSVQ